MTDLDDYLTDIAGHGEVDERMYSPLYDAPSTPSQEDQERHENNLMSGIINGLTFVACNPSEYRPI